MTTSHLQIRGKIFFLFDVEAHRFRLRWCQLEVGGVMKVWNLHTDFQTVMDTIAYAKDLILNHLTDQGQADAVDHVEWWIKGDSTFYCPLCMSALSPEGASADGYPFEALCLRCNQCEGKVSIPADAFAFEIEFAKDS